MRIVSQFSDYYDSCQHAAFEDSLVFVRKRAIYVEPGRRDGKLYDILADRAPAPSWAPKLVESLDSTSFRIGASFVSSPGNMDNLSFQPALVLLAGKPHTFLIVRWRERDVMDHHWAVGTYTERREFLHTLEDFDRFAKEKFESNGNKTEVTFRNTRGWEWVTRKDLKDRGRPLAEAFFAAKDLDHQKWAVDHKLPLVAVSGFTGEYIAKSYARDGNGKMKTSNDWLNVQVNPRLSDYEFFRKMDPTQVYQEISMFLGNLAAPDNVPVVVSDKDRIQQHGFDERSFRKAPTKHA